MIPQTPKRQVVVSDEDKGEKKGHDLCGAQKTKEDKEDSDSGSESDSSSSSSSKVLMPAVVTPIAHIGELKSNHRLGGTVFGW